MEILFLKILNMGLTACWLIMAVVILRLLLKKAPKWISCLLWALVAFKLICPVSIESVFSLIPSSEPLPQQIITENTFLVHTGVELVDTSVNEYLGEHYYEGVTVPADNGIRMMYVLGIIWAVGLLLFMLYGLISYYRLFRLTQARISLGDKVFQCDAIDTPFILGIIRPRICLPSILESEQAAYVIAHEQAHLKRWDHLWKPLGFLILAVYWFYPLVWLSYILFCRDMEAACDERVIREMGEESKKPYAQALLSCSVRQSMVTACPLAFGEVSVKERIKNVLHYKKPAFWVTVAAILCCIIAAVCFLTSPKRGGEKTAFEEETSANIEVLLATVREKESAENGQSADSDQAGELSRRQEMISDTLLQWRKAFVDRNGEELAKMMASELRKERFQEEGGYAFGWSSPWPLDADTDSRVNVYDEKKAEIYYYAYTSDPHVTSWKQTLQLGWENDACVITGEELTCYESISSGAEFEKAYPDRVDGTMMDYTKNGLGEALNQNAQLSSSMAYRKLFAPESAAAFLLNLSEDPNEVRYTLLEAEQDGLVGLEIQFLKDQTTFQISMLQPYGENGIWVPVNYRIDVIARMRKVDREQMKKLGFRPDDVPDLSGVLCIGEIPEKNIRVYGYNDEEIGGCGVMIEVDREIYFYDWYYITPRSILPKLYWDEAHERLQMSCYIYTGTGAAAEELHIMQRYGTMQETNFGLDAYSALLQERIEWRFEEETRTLTLTDKKTGKTLAEAAVPADVGEHVTDLELGMISSFVLGDEIEFMVSPGYIIDDMYGAACYEEMPVLSFDLVMTQGSNGHLDFALGDVTVGENAM